MTVDEVEREAAVWSVATTAPASACSSSRTHSSASGVSPSTAREASRVRTTRVPGSVVTTADDTVVVPVPVCGVPTLPSANVRVSPSRMPIDAARSWGTTTVSSARPATWSSECRTCRAASGSAATPSIAPQTVPSAVVMSKAPPVSRATAATPSDSSYSPASWSGISPNHPRSSIARASTSTGYCWLRRSSRAPRALAAPVAIITTRVTPISRAVLVARAVGRNATTRLAGANSLRNPRRTSATSTALLIGVTLVVMMATGAASARGALDDRLNQQYPVDVEARAMDDLGWFGEIPDQLAGEYEDSDGVAAVARLTGGAFDITTADGTVWGAMEGVAADPDAARQVLHSDDQVAGLADDTVVVPQDLAASIGIRDGDTLTFAEGNVGTPQTGTGTTTTLTAVVTTLPGTRVVLTREASRAVLGETPDALLWVLLDEHADAGAVVATLQTAASRSTSSTVMVAGAATERVAYQQLINTLLAIVIGLLAVSVVIALVGVANTLSLSVIERRRESATLRAIGLSKRQLRESLAAEGMIIAGVGAVAGAVIGTAYGWVGARTVMNQIGRTPFAVAWREVAIVVVVAVAAGLAATATTTT